MVRLTRLPAVFPLLLLFPPLLLALPGEARACACHGQELDAKKWEAFKKAYRPPAARASARKPSGENRPPRLPQAGSTGDLVPWGGADAAKWRPEAILANAASEALNAAWADPEVTDARVAVPTRFYDSQYHPYGDGQSNARASFESWKSSRPPLVATLLRFSSRPPEAVVAFDRGLGLAQTRVDVLYATAQGPGVLHLNARKNAAGDLVARWTGLPAELNWDSYAAPAPVLVRPSPGYDRWFPLSFRHAIRTTAQMVATVPAGRNHFSDGKPIVDPEGVAQTAGDPATPFEKLLSHAFPPRYNQRPYEPANIHGEFGAGGAVTGVGKGWTWVPERDAPFKIIYTCFERRQPAAEAAARDGGVASGGGWHRIGDPAETIFNSLESEPLVVASGLTHPAKAILPPGAQLSYELSDLAVVRWLQPGEAFVTVQSSDDESEYHWYFFQQSREVCTEEWVHPCVPRRDDPGFGC